MFWVELSTSSYWATYGLISQADLTGENRKRLIRLYRSSLPSFAIVDFDDDRLYWLDSGNVYFLPLGNKYAYRRRLTYFREKINPVDLAVYGDNLYWVDSNGRSIYWVNKAQPRDMFSFGYLTDGILVGAVVSDESRQPISKLWIH